MNDIEFLNTADFRNPVAIIDVFFKGCIHCEPMKSDRQLQDDFATVHAAWAERRDYCRLNYCRTEILPEWHEKAADIAGTEDYRVPVVRLRVAVREYDRQVTICEKGLTLAELASKIRSNYGLLEISQAE